MAVQPKIITKITIWEDCHFTDLGKIRCNICKKVYKCPRRMTVHLYYEHKIEITAQRSNWEKDNDSLWNFFTKSNFYIAKCKECGITITNAYNKSVMRHHLGLHTTIITTLKNTIDSYTWVSKYYVIKINKYKTYDIRCNLCKYNRLHLNEGIYPLRKHLILKHLINESELHVKTGDYNIDTIQQPAAQENYAATSHYDNAHSQDSGYQDNQNKETGEYNVDAMIQQPVAQENYPPTTFNYDYIHSQALGSQDNQNRFHRGTEEYTVDATIQQSVAQENYLDYYFQYTTSNYNNTHSQASGSQDNQNRETGEYNVDAIIQQPVAQENYPPTTFNYDYIHSQASESQDNQNRETGESIVDATIQQPVAEENYLDYYFQYTTSNYYNTHSQASGNNQNNQNRETEEYNVDAMIQQSVAQENYPTTTFNYDNTHSQALGSQDNQNRQTDCNKWFDEWMKCNSLAEK